MSKLCIQRVMKMILLYTSLNPFAEEGMIKYKHSVRRGMRWTYSLSLVIIKLEQLKAAVILQRSVKVPHTVVHFGNHCVVCKALTGNQT